MSAIDVNNVTVVAPDRSYENDVSFEQSSVDWSTNIDIYIPWSGKQNSQINGTDIRRTRDNKELPYLLHSIALNAPWVRRIWIMVNTENLPTSDVNIPAILKNRTSIIDRCTFMPVGTCPTRNGMLVKTFAHLFQQLSEWFIFVEDDIFLGRSVSPSDFYENGKPFVWRKKPTWGFFAGQEFHRLYKNPDVVSFPTPLSTSPSPHFWYPQLKSVCASLHSQYPEFYEFVGSHTGGRYSSLAKGVSDEDNSQEEDIFGWVNWELLRTGKGVYKNINSKRYEWWDEVEISEAGFKKALKDRPRFMNVNDRFSKEEKKYKQQISWFHDAMEEMFPLESVIDKSVIIGIGIPKAGSNKLDTMIPESFKVVSCNHLWSDLSLDSARASIYCSWGKTINHPQIKKDVLRRLGKECGYLGTHHDFSIASLLEGFNVSYVTMLRDPISRLVSACNYDLGKKCGYDAIVKLAQTNRGYGMPNRMTKMIAGLDPVCSLNPNITAYDDEAVLEIAKTNLRERFVFVGILERLSESIALLPSPIKDEVVLPRLDSQGGKFKGEKFNLTEILAPYINLDAQLYHFANQLLDKRLRQLKNVNNVEINNEKQLENVNNGEINNEKQLENVNNGEINNEKQLENVNNEEINDETGLRSRLDGPIPQDHSFLVNLIKQEFISPPPSKQSRDSFTEVMSKKSNSQFGQDAAILKFLNGLEGGFFIECGGNDGVSWSNTLMLELKHDWTGLLIEANPKQYKKLKSLNRHVNSINSCLSTSPYPEKLQFRSYTNHTGLSGLMSGAKGPHDTWHGQKLQVEDTVSIQCFPLYSILLAMGNPTVHYFSLDVEGVELQVLKTVPWGKVDIKILTVEASHSDAKSIKKFMEANNYVFHTKLTEDYVFVKKGFKIAQ